MSFVERTQIINPAKQPENLRLLVLDIDRTLTDQKFLSFTELTAQLFVSKHESLLVTCHDTLPKQAQYEIWQIFKKLEDKLKEEKRVSSQYIQTIINEWLAVWNRSGPLTKQKILTATTEIVSVAMSPETITTVQDLQRANQFHLSIVTASYKEFAQAIANALGISLFRYNPHYQYDRNGNVTNMRYNPYEAQRKIGQIDRLRKKLEKEKGEKIERKNTLVVDDNPGKIAHFFPTVSLNREEYPTNIWCALQEFSALPEALLIYAPV